jgi:serine-type D-Ala-D-Ala carboxypeptidase
MQHTLRVFEQAIESGAFPGGQLVVSVGGQRHLEVAAGRIEPSGPPTNLDVLYDLASLTKPLTTSLLIGWSMERRRLNLDTSMQVFFPHMPKGLRIGHGLEHSAGFLPHHRFDLMLPDNVRPETRAAYRFIIEQATRSPRLTPPGKCAVYSDIGFILLGDILEKVEDRTLPELVAALDLPLRFFDRRDQDPRTEPSVIFAPTEGRLSGRVHDENCLAMGGVAGHAGLFGTASEVVTVGERLLRAYHGATDECLKPTTVRTLWQPSRVIDSTRTYGWDQPSAIGSSAGSRWPRTSIGHLGFTGTSLWMEPERRVVASLITNRVCPDRGNERIRGVRPALHDAIWRDLFDDPLSG